MSVDPKDREAYERGRETNELNIIERTVRDVASRFIDSDSERSAYEKGRDREQFDGDKCKD